MAPPEVDWWPAVLVLAVGLIVGLVLRWRFLAGAAVETDGTPIERQDLEAERDVLLRQLRDLDVAAGASAAEPDVRARERYELELRAARIWRDLDHSAEPASGTRDSAAAPAAPPSPPLRSSQASGFVWGVVSALALGGLGFAVFRDAEPRVSPPAEVEAPSATDGEQTAADPQVARLQAVVNRSPDDLDARLDLARAQLERRDLMSVYRETQFVLERSPDHPRALSYQALVRLAMGQSTAALEMVDRAIAGAPELLEPYVHKALVLVQMRRFADADSVVKEAQSRHPGESERLDTLLDQLKSAALESPPLPENAHPEVARAPQSAVAGSDPGAIQGIIGLAPGTPSPAMGATLFVTARVSGVREGAPLAVQRLSVGEFPVRFRIGPENSMMGQELPERLRIEARVDSDGDPISRDPSDPSGAIDDVVLGRGDVRIELAR